MKRAADKGPPAAPTPPAEAVQAELLARIRHIWEAARTQVARSVNTAHVCANWLIGRQIVEAEQRGARRAGYGQALLKSLSAQLNGEYGSGFSVSALQYMRGFYLAYPDLPAKSTRAACRIRPADHRRPRDSTRGAC